MKALAAIILSSAIVFTNTTETVQLNYEPTEGHSEVQHNTVSNTYCVVTKRMSTTISQPTTIQKALILDKSFSVYHTTDVTKLSDFTQDIKYNYIASIDSSNKLLNTYLYQDWELIRYESDAIAIYVELGKGTDFIRMVIYPNLIKIYDKTL